MLTVAIIVSVSVTVRYTSPSYTDDDGLQYAPTDTRIIPFTGSLCQNLKLSIESVDSTRILGYDLDLYMLNSRPQLTGKQSFSVTEIPPFRTNDYVYYYYYLYPGSNFTVSACILESQPYNFYLFKGNKNFKKWRADASSPSWDRFKITQMCKNKNASKSYRVTDEDYYYLVFETDSPFLDNLNVTMSFFRTYYELKDNSSIVGSCTVTSESWLDHSLPSSCSVGAPLSGGTAFLEVLPLGDYPVDWKDGISLDTSCGPRIWMYAIISIAALIGCVGIIAVVATIIVVCVRRRRKDSPGVLTVPGVDASSAPLLNEPPQPDFQQNDTYGSNYESPPIYKP